MIKEAIWKGRDDGGEQLRSIDVEPAFMHGHLSPFFSNIVFVYQNGERQIFRTHIVNERAHELAEGYRKELLKEGESHEAD